MIENSDKIYSITDLIKEAKQGYFPFKSRITIKRMAERRIVPSHFTQIGTKYKNWWFIGSELCEWIKSSKLTKE